MSRMTEQIDHGPEVVQESYRPTLESVQHSHSLLNNHHNNPLPPSPHLFPFPSTNEKTPDVSSPGSHVDSKPTSDFGFNAPSPDAPSKARGPWGLSTVAFGLVVALITAIVVGGAVGGGVGAVAARKNNDLSKANEALVTAQATIQNLNQTQNQTSNATSSSNCTSSPTNGTEIIPTVDLANYTVEPAMDVQNVFLDCPNIASSLYTTWQNEKFSLYCGSAWISGLEAAQGGVVADMVHIVAYSVQDCLEACSGFNYEQRKWNGTARCRAMNFRANMAEKVEAIGGNCWLKNDTVKDIGAAPTADGVISGQIVD